MEDLTAQSDTINKWKVVVHCISTNNYIKCILLPTLFVGVWLAVGAVFMVGLNLPFSTGIAWSMVLLACCTTMVSGIREIVIACSNNEIASRTSNNALAIYFMCILYTPSYLMILYLMVKTCEDCNGTISATTIWTALIIAVLITCTTTLAVMMVISCVTSCVKYGVSECYRSAEIRQQPQPVVVVIDTQAIGITDISQPLLDIQKQNASAPEAISQPVQPPVQPFT